jgi:predicted ATPase
MRRTIAEYRRMGSEMLVPWNHTIIAEALNRAGKPYEAHATLDEAFAVMNRTQERHYEAETQRVRAETYLLQSEGEGILATRAPFVRKAQECLAEAIKIARGQGAVAYELRAAVPLARLWIAEGKHSDARRMLEETRSRIGEDWNSPELEEAGKILGHSA